MQGNRIGPSYHCHIEESLIHWAAFEALEGFTCLRTLSSQIRQFSYVQLFVVTFDIDLCLVDVIFFSQILVINSCHPCVIWAIGTTEQLQVSGGIIPRPPTVVKSKRFPDLSFSSVGRTGIHPIIWGWEVMFPSRSIYRLLDCGTQAKAIFGSQSATCLLPLASQAGVAEHVVYIYASGGATDRNIPSFSVNIMLMWLDTLGVGGWVGWVFLSVDLCLVYLGSREYWLLWPIAEHQKDACLFFIIYM